MEILVGIGSIIVFALIKHKVLAIRALLIHFSISLDTVFYLFYLLLDFRLLVGAPTADSGQPGVTKGGAVFRCKPQSPDSCQQIPFDATGKILNFAQKNSIFVLYMHFF